MLGNETIHTISIICKGGRKKADCTKFPVDVRRSKVDGESKHASIIESESTGNVVASQMNHPNNINKRIGKAKENMAKRER